jgi:hypothetical protein
LSRSVDPARERAACHLAHAHAQFAVVDAGADGVRAAQVLPVVHVGAASGTGPGEAKTSRKRPGTSKDTMTASSVSGSIGAPQGVEQHAHDGQDEVISA